MIKLSEEYMAEPKVLLQAIDEEIAGTIAVDQHSEAIKNMQYGLEQDGQITPVLMYKDKLVEGRHRCTCLMNMGIKVRVVDIDPAVTRDEVIDYITMAEMVNKGLSPWQKAIIAQHRYREGRKWSLAKTSKMANVRKDNIAVIEFIMAHPVATRLRYIDKLRENAAVCLSDGSWTKSGTAIK